MPAERTADDHGMDAASRLSFDELETMARAFAGLGVRKLRITGGEPLVSPKLEHFLRGVSRLGLQDIGLTSNGQLLSRKLPLLLECGLKRINVSLDTLDPVAFKRIARGGDLPTVLQGLAEARTESIKIKINMVPLRGQNHEQVLPMLDYCLENGFELRFIELMRMGHLAREGASFQQQFYGMPELLEKVAERHEFVQAPAPLDATALRYEIPGRGFFGVIANESVPFCRTCSRLRLSSTGWLHGCLLSSNRHYVGDLLDKPRHQALPALQRLLVRALADKQEVAFEESVTVMKIIGG